MITVVSGLPRSGTSLMMQMLSAGGMDTLTDGSRPPDEDNQRGYFEYQPVLTLASERSWVPLAEGKAVKVVHLLLASLPAGHDYRIILMHRRIEEVLASQRCMLERLGEAIDPSADAALASVFEAQMTQVSALIRNDRGWPVLDVSYNALMADPATAASSVAEFIGAASAAADMAAVVVPALYRQRLGEAC